MSAPGANHAPSSNPVPLLRRSLRRRWIRWTAPLVIFLFLLSAAEFLLRFLPFNPDPFTPRYTSKVIRDRHQTLLRTYLAEDQHWRIPARLAAVAPAAVQATLAAEDRRFYRHRGIDWLAVARASFANLKSGRIVSGASTISMQVAGFAIPTRERTVARKFRQTLLALQLERHWTKQQILEAYLTHASYGGNISGIEAAAMRYFDKSAAELTRGEAALLAGIPQSPERFRPDRHAKVALHRREYVLRRMLDNEVLSPAEFKMAAGLPLALKMEPQPVYAPHFCDHIRHRFPGEKNLRTTLDLPLQLKAEKALANAVKTRAPEGVTNGAVVIIDNQTGEILSMVGSVDYWNRPNHGQVNAALAFRSPGSVLKPLIFARALDIGAITPDETLFDVPMTRAGYSPRNFDNQFRGPVPAPKALAWSLNIPAMDVLQRVGVPEFTGFLSYNEIPLRISKHGDPGLSLAIGTCSARLLDVTRAYASLAAGGRLNSPAWLKSESPVLPHHPPANQWISPGAASVVLQALADETIRSPEEISPRLHGATGIAWKTGTSNGLRDAWTIAVTKDITVGVWLGNMNGQASRALVGSTAAAPLALELASSLSRSPGRQAHPADAWPNTLAGTVKADACDITGLPASTHCPTRTARRFLKNRQNLRRCHAHETVQIDRETGRCLCSHCIQGLQAESSVRLRFIPEVTSWLRSAAHPWADQLIPSHNPNCSVGGRYERPSIISPTPGSQIVLLDELPMDQQKIALTARTGDPGDQLFWFINGKLNNTAKAADTTLFLPEPGSYHLVCTDRQGRSAETRFTVLKSSSAK